MVYFRDSDVGESEDWVACRRLRIALLVVGLAFGLGCVAAFCECVFRILRHEECALHYFLPQPTDRNKAYRSVPYGYGDPGYRSQRT